MIQSLCKIGSKIADVTELSKKAKELTINSELLLIAVQQEIENIYISLAQQENK